MFKKLFGLSPTPTDDGAYAPSKFALKMATSPTTDFDKTVYPNPYKDGKLKILMVCTEERNMTMANGKKFSTGNHPVEMIVPMLHLINAGFDIDIYTPTGDSVKIEMWAMPTKDEAVMKLYNEFKSDFDNPKNLSEFVSNKMEDSDEYIAIYLPGGHGAMLGLPENKDLCNLLHWSHQKNLFMLAICHGPAALLAASLNKEEPFPYKGYEMVAFPDAVDKQTPAIGYMPGHMPWKFGEKLTNLGITIINKKADDTCFRDRKLISGAGPKAANNFGKLAANVLLEEVHS